MAKLKEIIGEELFKQLPAEKQKELAEQNLEDVSGGAYIPKERFDEVNKEAKEYKKQVATRDEQISNLKTEYKDVEGLKEKVSTLEEENTKKAKEYEDSLKQIKFNNVLDNELKGANAKNTKALKALLDMEKIKLDGDTLIGLKDQLDALKKESEYLFEKEIKGTSSFNTGGSPADPTKTENFATKLGKQKAEEIKSGGLKDFIK